LAARWSDCACLIRCPHWRFMRFTACHC